MATRVISIVNNKGGVGKTLLSYVLLYLFTKMKYKAILIDCDNDQFSSAEFAAMRKGKVKPELEVLNVPTNRVREIVAKLGDYDIIIIEFGKANDDAKELDRVQAMKLAVALADLILMPMQPTPADVKAAPKTISKLPLDGKVPALIVPNRVKTKAQLKVNILDAAHQFKHFSVTKSYIKDRLIYQNTFSLDGRTPFEDEGKEAPKAQEEFLNLFNEIKPCLRLEKR